MKRKNAFALRGFDKRRILQRPFFKDFHFSAEKTDEEILASLGLSEDDSLSVIERKHKTLNEIFDRLVKFRALIINHSDNRLDVYRKIVEKKIDMAQTTKTPSSMKTAIDSLLYIESLQKKYKREQGLAVEYCLCTPSYIEDLAIAVNRVWLKLENKLQEKYREIFAERLKTARIKSGFTRKQLGDVIHISPNGFGLYETGKREPTLTSLIRLARTLNVSADWLIGVAP